MKSRAISAVGALAAFSLLLAACSSGSSTEGTEGEGSSEGTITVAPILTSSGALADNAETVRQTWEYAVDEVNAAGGAGGYQFKVSESETDATPATSLRAATQAVNQDGAKVLAFQTSPENAAISAQLEGLDALSINTMAQDDGLRGEACSLNAFSFVQSSSMLFNTLGSKLEELEGDKWAIMAVDYSTGHGAAQAFSTAAEEHGKEIVSEQFAPLNTTDYGSYITEIQRSGADGLFVVMYGPDAEAFVTQAAQYALSDQMKTTLTMNVITENSFETMGDYIVGDYLVKQYDPNADNETNRAFVEGYTEAYGIAPNDYAGNTYLGAQALFAAVEKAGSDDTTAIRDALSGMTFDSIAGEVTVRAEDHQVLTPIYLSQVVEEDGGLEFSTLSSTPGEESAPDPSPECQM